MQPYNDFKVGDEVVVDTRAIGGRQEPYKTPYYKGKIVTCSPSTCDIEVTDVQSFTIQQAKADPSRPVKIGDTVLIHKAYLHKNMEPYNFTTHRNALTNLYQSATGQSGGPGTGPANIIAEFAGFKGGKKMSKRRTRKLKKSRRRLVKK